MRHIALNVAKSLKCRKNTPLSAFYDTLCMNFTTYFMQFVH